MSVYDDDADRLNEECEYCGHLMVRCHCGETCLTCGATIGVDCGCDDGTCSECGRRSADCVCLLEADELEEP